MNIVAYLFLFGGVTYGVLCGDSRPNVFNKADERAVTIVIVGVIFAAVDTFLTLAGMAH